MGFENPEATLEKYPLMKLAARPIDQGGLGFTLCKLTFCMFIYLGYRKGTAWWTTSRSLRRSLTDDSGSDSFRCRDQGGCTRRNMHAGWTFSGQEAQVYPEKLADHVRLASLHLT